MNGYGDSERLWGERNIYSAALSLAIENSDKIVPKLLFASGLLKGVSFKSKVASEFRAQLFALMKEPSHSVNEFDKLAPLLLKKFNNGEGYSDSLFKNKYGPIFDEWLISLESVE